MRDELNEPLGLRAGAAAAAPAGLMRAAGQAALGAAALAAAIGLVTLARRDSPPGGELAVAKIEVAPGAAGSRSRGKRPRTDGARHCLGRSGGGGERGEGHARRRRRPA